MTPSPLHRDPRSVRGHRPSQSFLVRMWVEPREVTGGVQPVRVYVRNLKTGEETYVGDPADLGPYLSRQVEGRGEDRLDDRPLRNGTDGSTTLE